VHRALRRPIVALLCALVWPLVSGGCLRTAECDQSFPCEEGRVCYNYFCREICEDAEDCGASESCLPCDEPQPDGRGNACFGDETDVSACVPEDAP
jgi:hypothetical protein